MQLVGYECRMWMPLDLIPSHNWLVNNLVPVLPGTGPENSQAAYSFCFLSSRVFPTHKHQGVVCASTAWQRLPFYMSQLPPVPARQNLSSFIF